MSLLIPKDIPPGIDVDVHMKMASVQWEQSLDIAAFMIWFYHKVRNGGPWDFKQQESRFENYGNFHYGAVGTAGGLPEEILLRAAGYAQKKADTQSKIEDWSQWYGVAPYGDDPKDQPWILKGMRYAEIKGY